jgi:hypothetical protein
MLKWWRIWPPIRVCKLVDALSVVNLLDQTVDVLSVVANPLGSDPMSSLTEGQHFAGFFPFCQDSLYSDKLLFFDL